MKPLRHAQSLLEANISVVPIKPDGSKSPAVPWKRYQKKPMTVEEAERLFSSDCGIGIIAGAVSGNLEVIDVEGPEKLGGLDLWSELSPLIEEARPGLLDRCPQTATPSGGRHIFFRCSSIEGNQKLAIRADVTGRPEVLIETRGEGGQVLAPGCPAGCHSSGRLYTLVHGRITETPDITPEEREILLDCCRSFNTYIPPERYEAVRRVSPNLATEGKPGTDYARRGDVLGLLISHGWGIERRDGEEYWLKRPGKNYGTSAVWHASEQLFYVFSTNAHPFAPDRAYNPFAVYALLEHAGDFRSAARKLKSQGYGATSRLNKTQDASVKVRSGARTVATRSCGTPTSSDRLGRELDVNPEMLRERRLPAVTMPQRDLTCQPRTDAGNADRIMALHGEGLRYVRERKAFIFWNGTRWEFDLTGQAERFAIDTARETYRQSAHLGKAEGDALASHARNSEAARAIRAALDLVRCAPGMTISAADLDADPYLLGLPNGVLDLRTQELIDPDRVYLITKSAGTDFEAKAECPTWLRFLTASMGSRAGSTPEQREAAQHRVRFLQKAAGVSLSGDTSDKVLFALLGPTNSGKTTFLEVVRAMLGDYGGQILVSSLLANGKQSDNNSQADIADLIGLRFVTTSEAESQHRLEEGKLKYLTQGQGTKLKAARKYENPVEFRATHKLWMDTNELPRIKTTDDSVWNRLKPIPFEYRVADSEIDRDLPRKLKAELPGILRWAVEGFRLWQLEGLGDPPDVAQARQAWRDDCDPLSDFIAENCRLDPNAWAPTQQLRDRYKDHCRETGKRFPLGERDFGARLKTLGCTEKRRYHVGQTQRGWQGIEIV